MPINVPKLTGNLKNLKSTRRYVSIIVDDAVRIRLQLSVIILESQAARLVDQVLDYLKVNKSPDSSPDPILIVNSRIIELASSPTPLFFIGTSLAVEENILLARTFDWVPPVVAPTAPTNASAEVWSAVDTVSVVRDLAVSAQLLNDVGRLLDVFAADWQSANQ